MNQLTKMFEGKEVRVLTKDGETYFVGKDVAEILGYTNPHKAIRDHCKGVNVSFVPSKGGRQEVKVIPERDVYRLVMRSKLPAAEKFEEWVVSEVIPSIRKTGSYSISDSSSAKDSFELQLIGVDYASKILRLDKTSTVLMLESAHKQHGVSTSHLPAYVDEEGTEAATALLKKFGASFGAAKFNTKLIELGILEIKERPSTKGGTKEFKSLTEKGLGYGKNLLSPRNPKETQPHYYPSKFGKLLELCTGRGGVIERI